MSETPSNNKRSQAKTPLTTSVIVVVVLGVVLVVAAIYSHCWIFLEKLGTCLNSASFCL